MTVKQDIAAALAVAARAAGASGALPDFEVGRARNAAHGDYASPAGLKLARDLRLPPPAIAETLAGTIEVAGGAATPEAAGGYVNFRLSPEWLRDLVREVAAAGPAYGASTLGAGEKVQVEFVSINPTGPLHIGNGRGAILGDSLARLLKFTGHDVTREYYVNDFGTQARKFGLSIQARLDGTPAPEGGYEGEYVTEIAEAARSQIPGLDLLPSEEAVERLREFGAEWLRAQFQVTLEQVGIHFDVWLSERSLWDRGRPQEALETLREMGLLLDRDGAVWFAPAVEEGPEETDERVVIRSDGLHTYFASDLGYMLDRFRGRGFARVIEVWGADHHGYVQRFLAGAAALGLDPSRFEIIIHQMVNLKEGKMSKRKGRFVTLQELVDRVGVDAVRYFYLLRSPDAMMDFDLELAVAEGRENPVYYAQYAHARLANVERVAAERHGALPAEADLSLLDQPWELDVAREIAFWPDAVEEAARLREPHRIPYYVQQLADRVHGFYDAGNRDGANRVVVDSPELTRARLELSRAARNTLRSALDLMGVSAPDRM